MPVMPLRMKPMVSVNVTSRPSGSLSLRVVESKVAKSLSMLSTSASVRALIKLDFPALV